MARHLTLTLPLTLILTLTLTLKPWASQRRCAVLFVW
jgi:hypothetical protein